MTSRIGNPVLRVNNEPFPIVPNSFKFTEGDGETTVETQTIGNDVEIVTSDSGEDKMTTFSFDVMNTEDNIKRLRGIKKNPGNNVFDYSEGSFSRVVQSASITNNYEIELSATGKATIECKGAPSI